MKRGLILLAIRAMQIKASMIHLIPMTATKIKKTDINIGLDVERLDPLYIDMGV